jgi:lysophospholipase L1-like esterase
MRIGDVALSLSFLAIGCGSSDVPPGDDPADPAVAAAGGGGAAVSHGGAGAPDGSASLRDAAAAGGHALDAGSVDAPTALADRALATFDPCPAAQPCKIMPLGDSITDGAGSSGGGYRVELFTNIVGARKSATFVGTQSNGPDTVSGRAFPKHHEGHPGYTIDGSMGIQPLVVATLQANEPSIVLLMIGTNDVNGWVDLADAPTRLGGLLDLIIDTVPNALLVAAAITPTTDDDENTRIDAFNGEIPALVESRAAAGKHIVMVDMFKAFAANPAYKTAYMSDFIHPNDAGYVVMGDTWYPGLAGYLH